MEDQQMSNLGFLFPKMSKAGKKYLSGKITINGEEKQIAGFYSKSKKGENYISLVESQPRETKPVENIQIQEEDYPF